MVKKIYKNLSILLILIFSFTFLLPVSSFGHPGRTDRYGGHYVRTPGWGYPVGSYHYHNGGYSEKGDVISTSSSQTIKKRKKKAAAVTRKTIIAVEKAYVYLFPQIEPYFITGELTYGTEIKDLGGTPGWNTISFGGLTGYVSKNVTTFYTPIKPKVISIRSEIGYFFSAPFSNSKNRGSAPKNTKIKAIGENGNWYYVEITDETGYSWNAFVSKNIAW
ncbi:SH3 domain-containing protein [Carboxydocella sp. ULO1]|uniref:SH3 domain-containing protein n=1 Tax=Carboxydocella sp. ULO1 TaxID=1926599 RepID=UPI0009ACFDA1|nr:SH3 domain-containing protein [Carboxydocella sp. ULO1]GAW28548.1 hypothetical protein ULO1_11180 [Carboxydocella sp. ULO1]